MHNLRAAVHACACCSIQSAGPAGMSTPYVTWEPHCCQCLELVPRVRQWPHKLLHDEQQVLVQGRQQGREHIGRRSLLVL